MKKIILLSFVLLTARGFAQEVNTDQNVELPEFVITGVERVDIPVVQKQKTEHVPEIVKGYIQQAPSADELKMADLSNPIKENSELLDNPQNINGRLELGVGRYTLPTGSLMYQVPYKVGLFMGQAYGFDEKEYKDYAGLNQSGLALQNTFFISTGSGFLPGSEFRLKADYDRTSYNFFASDLPERERNLHDLNLLAGFYNGMGKVFKLGINLAPEFYYVKEDKFDLYDNKINLNANADLMLGNFSIEAYGGFINQSLKNNPSGVDSYNAASFKALAKLQMLGFLSAGAGFNVQTFEGENFASPIAEVGFKFSNELSAYLTYSPNAQLMTIADFIKGNRYYEVDSTDNVFFEKDIDVTGIVKYEYYKYFEINGGASYTASDNYPYYNDQLALGTFGIQTVKASRFSVFTNLLFHLGPFGTFYGDVTYQRVVDENDNYLTYNPEVVSNLAYSYNFKFGLLTEAKLKLASQSYADLANEQKINEYVNVGLKLSYPVFRNFRVFMRMDNLLNSDNYYTHYYQEKPLDLIFGFNYIW